MSKRSGHKTPSASSQGTAPSGRQEQCPPDYSHTASLMTKRVQRYFEQGYTGKGTGSVAYELDEIQGLGADEVFFGVMIYKRILFNLGKGNLKNNPEPPEGTKTAAMEHGKAAKLAQGGIDPLKLSTILRTFYMIKEEVCPSASAKRALGFVCDF